MSGYGSLAGGRGPHSLIDRVQDTIFALTSSLPCHGMSWRDFCTALPEGGTSASNSNASNGQSSGNVKLNGRNVQIVKLLGEGGFSFVYLARDRESGREFALKKIRCPAGSEALPLALAELESHRRFHSPYIMKLLDSAIVQEMDGKTVYLFLPYQPMGNVQDYINKGLVLGRRWAEKSLLEVFLGTCYGVKELHCYKLKDVGVRRVDGEGRGKGQMTPSDGMFVRSEEEEAGGGALREDTPGGDKAPLIDSSHTGGDGGEGYSDDNGDDGDDDEMGQSSYPPKKKRDEYEQRQPRPGGDDLQGVKGGELVPYAHRDIKPGNIMLSPSSNQEGEATLHPVLMDFGSTCRARLHITSRREAIAEQDVAAERSSMAYRAPELFDIKTDTTLTEAVDIWSLGCTLYCMMYSYSPFETPTMIDQGGSVAMAVLQNNWKFPTDEQNDSYSQASREIIKSCLITKVEARATIDQVITMTKSALQRVS
ncbi:hypothetical protein CBS101457_002059 [Exobasidium rhododendri]|nr:hypothetical protein CBS101457_002059 [Exobasidium rhododendri]